MATTVSADSEVSADTLDKMQRRANQHGMTVIQLDSSWWGHEKFASWQATWSVAVDIETDDALHVVGGSTGMTFDGWFDAQTEDTWVPKSAIAVQVDPDMKVAPPEGDDLAGTIRVIARKKSEFGMKLRLGGDTYDAFKEDDATDAIGWDTAHPTFDGETWCVDAGAITAVVSTLRDLGYRVEMPEGFMPE